MPVPSAGPSCSGAASRTRTWRMQCLRLPRLPIAPMPRVSNSSVRLAMAVRAQQVALRQFSSKLLVAAAWVIIEPELLLRRISMMKFKRGRTLVIPASNAPTAQLGNTPSLLRVAVAGGAICTTCSAPPALSPSLYLLEVINFAMTAAILEHFGCGWWGVQGSSLTGRSDSFTGCPASLTVYRPHVKAVNNLRAGVAFVWSGWQDLNLRPPRSKRGRLTRLTIHPG